MQILLNDGWSFAKNTPENFIPVELPHDWLISDVNRLYESGTGWYRRELRADAVRPRLTAGDRRVYIHFDGVYMDSTLYVNGKLVGQWKYGYTAFEYDITDLLLDTPNVLLLKVDYKSPNSRWYSGAGIYRDVHLKIKNACHFVTDGIYVTTFKEDGQWRWEVSAETETGGKPYETRHTLLSAAPSDSPTVGANCVRPHPGAPEDNIISWDITHPRLYTLRSELIVDGEVTDVAETRVGFREIEFTTDRGFFLNGRHVKLNGVCLHHDLGALGAASHKDAIRRQLTILRSMGVNALRTAHNPPSKIFMETADEMGFLVMSEILDMWRHPKTTFDYARFFDQWIERDVASWIRRDRNHPSVIMWSVGNEIPDTHADAEEGAGTLRRLMALVARHDPKVHAPVTLCSNYMPWENTQHCADIIKLIGYNYAEYLYEEHHAAHPNWIIYGSETGSTVQSRGVYHFPLTKSILADDDLQCSALGNSSTSWGAKNVEACIEEELPAAEFSLGQFVWSGQDYIGEPTPYHTKNSYFGHIDTAGFPKDSYYLFQAAWTDYKHAPMIHLLPYWDFSPGQIIDVRVYSNAPRVELFLNGESLGLVELTLQTERRLRFCADWRVAYQPGVLRAVAYDEGGAVVAEAERQSFGEAVALSTESEVFGELTFMTITALDAMGRVVENANRRVRVYVENGELLGLDNGDSTDYDQYKTDSRRLFNGKLLAIVRAFAPGVNPQGAPPKITAELDESDIPVRKIELTAETLVSSTIAYNITAKIFPQNATYTDLHWRLTDAGGIDSPLGTLACCADGPTSADGTPSAVITPKGDGEVFVRCSATNGRGHVSLISQISLTIEGMGVPFLNPYEFVAGGLYNRCNTEPSNGNERGVATLRDGETHVGFANLDFGGYGSDEIILPLFALDKSPFTFEIWDGMPEDGGEKLCDAYYDKGSIWNTYQEAVYRLPRRLRGVRTLCLVFRQKVHIKGFRFKKYQKAFMKINAAENDGIYGDSFLVTGGANGPTSAVERIGNNVSLIYEGMDFGEQGADSVELCWRSGQAKNSVQFVFQSALGPTSAEGEIRRMIEVANSPLDINGQAEEYTSERFTLGGTIYGNRKVSIIFLPGCDLDLAWFKFGRSETEVSLCQ